MKMNSIDYINLFYNRLSMLRNNLGISARDMSLSLGQSESYINKIENRKALPSMQSFFYICEYLGIHPKDFFDDTIDNPIAEKEYLSKVRLLTPTQQQHILAIINDLLTIYGNN